MSNFRRNLFTTKKGQESLGEYVRRYRTNLPYEFRLEDLRNKIIEETGYTKCSLASLSKFENGQMRYSQDLIVAIATVLRIPNPREDRFYNWLDFHQAACENLDLDSGLPLQKLEVKE